jgi:hypothetical protein
MKEAFRKITLSLLLLSCLGTSLATPTSENTVKEPIFSKLWIFSYLYNANYDFNDKAGDNTNKYNGTTNFYNVNLAYFITPRWIVNFSALHIHSDINSAFTTPFTDTLTHQLVDNNSVIFRVIRKFNENFYFGLRGSTGWGDYDQSRFVTVRGNPFDAGFVQYNGRTYMAGLFAFYRQSFHQIRITSLLSLFHLKGANDGYQIGLTSVNPLTVETNDVLATLRLTYFKWRNIRPFISVGGILVLGRDDSRPLDENIGDNIGPIPALSLDDSGYQVGAGFQLFRIIHVGYWHRVRGAEYYSNDILVSIAIPMDRLDKLLRGR